jgi:hypothetical protein
MQGQKKEHLEKSERCGSAGLLFPAFFLEERAEPVGAPFTGKELNISSSDQPEDCEEEKIRGAGEEPVLGKHDHENQRDNHADLVFEGIRLFRTGREETGDHSGNDMPATGIPAGTFRAEGIDYHKARQQYPDNI